MKGGRKSRWRTGVVAIGSIAEMTDDLNKRVLNRGLGDTNLGDVVLKASNASNVEIKIGLEWEWERLAPSQLLL
jgi:hypothetical protein